MAANFTANEKNAELKFNFMLHADKKAAGKWKDLPIPFPVVDKIAGKKMMEIKADGISQLPQHLKESIVYREDS